MSSASVPSTSISSSSSVERRENKNNFSSKITKIALASIFIIASYAFFPPIGSAITISIITFVTILSFAKSNNLSPSSSSHENHLATSTTPRYYSWTYPWTLFFTPTFLPSTRRESIRTTHAGARAPVGTGRISASSRTTSSFVSSSTPSQSSSPSPTRRESIRATPAGVRAPVGTGGISASSRTSSFVSSSSSSPSPTRRESIRVAPARERRPSTGIENMYFFPRSIIAILSLFQRHFRMLFPHY